MRMQYFREFDKSHWQGTSLTAQWVGKVQKRYNTYVTQVNKVLEPCPDQIPIIKAIEELKKLARLRLYEVRCIKDEFDVNDDGPGNADFICTNACTFMYAMYKARFSHVVWQCMRGEFPNLVEPSGVLASNSDVISNKMCDEPAHKAFCTRVEESLRSEQFSNRVLGPNAHAWFLTTNDETLYEFQNSWVDTDVRIPGHACSPIHYDDPDYNYYNYKWGG